LVLAGRKVLETLGTRAIRQAWLVALQLLLLVVVEVAVFSQRLRVVLAGQVAAVQTEAQAVPVLAVKALTAVQVSLLVLLQLLAAVAVDQVR
jgi:hypothetical protein